MYPDKRVGIVAALMSALSIVGRAGSARTSKPQAPPDANARASINDAMRKKESYFEMARHSRWN